MPQAKRNDPCPCGSGRKYKSCCMRRDQFSESRELSLSAEEGVTLNAVYEYAQGDRFVSDTAAAFNFYWGGNYALDGIPLLHPDDQRRTVEWLVHDYRTSTDDGSRIIDLFIENQAVDAPPQIKRILEAWSASSTGLFRVLGRRAGALDLFDLLRQEELTVLDASLARAAQDGELLAGRLYTLDGDNRLSLMTLVLPGEFGPGLVKYTENARALYLDQHPQSTLDEFLRENGHIVQAYLISYRADALRHAIGPGTRYHDPSPGRDILHGHTEIRQREYQEQVRETETARQPQRALDSLGRIEPKIHRTSSGIILPGAVPEEIPVETEEEETPRPTILIPGRDG